MVNRPHRSGRRVVAALAATSCAALTVALLSTPTQAAPQEGKRSYIVMTKTSPLVSYDGGVRGFSAKAVKDAVKNNPRTALAREYSQHLAKEHDAALADAGISKSAKTDDFSIAFNGFSARLTPSEAAELQKAKDVVYVWKDEKRYADTITTPDFLGMSGDKGVWQTQFKGQKNAGAGVIVGVLDSGIWPENPSFASNPLSSRAQAIVDAKWKGGCDSGDEEPVECNDKLIGARYYTQGNTVEDFEFVSPRDYNGHGSHTAGTAGGNGNVKMSINGNELGVGSGMAPAARIAAYKVLWATPDGRASGSTAAIVAAIDDAVADGVDVINYSISGSSQYIVSPDEIGFLNAAASGVFISASAGNSGDTGPSTVAHNSPWDMTVAASTHSRGAANKVKLGNGAEYAAVGATDTGVGPAPLVDSTTVGLASATPTAVKQCNADDEANPLDPAKVAGKIVICTRGGNARVGKSQVVKEAGGVGMILVNASDAQSLNADFHIIPTAHVNATDGAAIKAYAASAGDSATATITARDKAPVRAPEMAGFSSSGPALAADGDLLKPDITAPGVDVIAAVSPAGNDGNDFNGFSGTSMSAPHIAGLAALMMQKNPSWSPMWVKSAMMTTATTRDNTGKPIQRTGANATPHDFGNGHVRPANSYDPGLVYDNGVEDWIRFGCGIEQFQLVTEPAFCEKYGKIAPSQLNYPSISVAGLAGAESVTRTVTNITDKTSVYTAKIQAPAGFRASLSTSRFTIRPGETKSYTVTFTRTSAAMNKWSFGSLTWVDQRGHEVRSSIAVEAVPVSAPAETSISGASGSKKVDVTAGYTGKLEAKVAGLVPAEVTVVPTALDQDSETELTVPAGTKVLRIATYDADYPAGTDLDLVVYNGAGERVGSSGNAGSDEDVTLEGDDLGGTYYVVADFFSGEGDSLDIALNTFAVGDAAAGNLTATPASQNVTTAKPATVTLDWQGLDASKRYLGVVRWSDGSTEIGRTLVSAN